MASAVSSSAQSIEIPPIPPSAESSAIKSARKLGGYFCTVGQLDILTSSMPLYTLFHTKIVCLISTMNQVNSAFLRCMLSHYQQPERAREVHFLSNFNHPSLLQFHCKSKFRIDACLYIFYRILSQSFESDGKLASDISPLLNFLGFIKGYVQKNMEGEGSKVMKSIDRLFDSSIDALKHCDFNVLKKTPLELGFFSDELKPAHRYRCAMKNYVFLFVTLHHLCLFERINRCVSIQTFSISSESEICLFLSIQMKKILADLIENTSYPNSVKVHLFLLAHRPFNRLMHTDENLRTMQTRLFSLSSLKYYQEVICTEKAQEIAATHIFHANESVLKKPERSFLPIGPNPVHPRYAEENRDVFENFIPRVHEMADYIGSTSAQAQKDLTVLREFSLFLQFGDVDRLLTRLKCTRGNQDLIDIIVLGEIEKFCKERHQKKSFVPSEFYQRSLEGFKEIESLWTIVPQAVKGLLQDKLEVASKWEADLFPPAPKKSTRHPRPNLCPSQPLQAPIQQMSSSSGSVEPPTLPEESQKIEASIQPTVPPSFSELLEKERRLLQIWLEQLSSNQPPCTREALSDAYEHFDNLLCSMRRIKPPLERNILSAFVNDTVRHCTLGVEQLLSALNQATNGIKTKKELAPYLTHDLFQLLQNCNLDKGDFPHTVRKWIGEINRGEIIVRDFSLHTSRKTVLQNLLRENRRLKSGSEHMEPLFNALLDYLTPLGTLLETIQDRFPSRGPNSQFEAKCDIAETFSDLVTIFCQELAKPPYLAPAMESSRDGRDSNELLSSLLQLRTLLKNSADKDSSSQFNGCLDNVLNNLLVHLETEALSHAHLEPIEASLHLSNVLLLNQFIMESILINKLDAVEMPVDFEEKSQHDLLGLVSKLKIRDCFDARELDFLKMGKLSRQLIRYPTSYISSGSNQKKGGASRLDKIHNLLRYSRTLANKQTAGLELKGFTSAIRADAKKLEEVKAFAAQDIHLLCSIAQKIL